MQEVHRQNNFLFTFMFKRKGSAIQQTSIETCTFFYFNVLIK